MREVAALHANEMQAVEDSHEAAALAAVSRASDSQEGVLEALMYGHAEEVSELQAAVSDAEENSAESSAMHVQEIAALKARQETALAAAMAEASAGSRCAERGPGEGQRGTCEGGDTAGAEACGD